MGLSLNPLNWDPLGLKNDITPGFNAPSATRVITMGTNTTNPKSPQQQRPQQGRARGEAGGAVKGTSTGTSNAQYYGGGGYSAGGAAATANNTQNIDLVNHLFDAKIGGLRSQLGVLGSQQDASEARIGNQYQTKYNDLNENFAFGKRNLGESRNKVNESRARSLQDIRDRLQTQNMSYNNQLGAMGAGDSSAAGQIGMALSGMASKNRGDVQNNASDQLGAIQTQEETLTREFDRNKRDLDSWRQQTLSDLATEILQTKQKIQEAIGQADAQRAQQLADYDASYTQQAIEALDNLENTYSSNAKALADRYRGVLAPQTIRIDPALQKYAVKPIDAGTLRGIEMPEYVNPETEAIAIMKKREEDAQNAILNPDPIA